MDEKVKDLLDKIRGAADTAKQTARVAGRKTGQMVDVAKLNVQLYDLNGELDDTLRQLGQVMYDAHLGSETPEDQVNALLTRAEDLYDQTWKLRDRIADLRYSRTCPACGASCGKDDLFCSRCGGQL